MVRLGRFGCFHPVLDVRANNNSYKTPKQGSECPRYHLGPPESPDNVSGARSYGDSGSGGSDDVRDEDGFIGVRPYKEIPHSGYLMEATGSLDPSIVPDEPESASFGISPVIRDTYIIALIGFGNTKYFIDMTLSDKVGKISSILNNGYITAGTTQQYSIYIDPMPGAPAPTITKEVTFDVLRGDVNVAYKLNQLDNDKFKDELIKIIDRAEKLSIKCDKKKKDKECGNKKASVNQLNSLIKRMEQALKKDAKGKDKKKKKFIKEIKTLN